MAPTPPYAEFERKLIPVRVEVDWNPRYTDPKRDHIHEQAARCTDCGIPFCEHACPLGNEISDFNQLAGDATDDEKPLDKANDRLVAAISHTNNFPEMTGTMCPAPCEDSCVHSIVGGDGKAWGAVTIKDVEHFIADKIFEQGLVPQVVRTSTGKRIAIVGSGPAGLAAAQQLTRSGHQVTVFERDDASGGLVRYGIPDFKFNKRLLDERLSQMEQEGTHFVTGHEVSDPNEISDYDSVVLATGMRKARDIDVPGRELEGVFLAIEYLVAQNKALQHRTEPYISAQDKTVVVIGGGDTGDDCVGVAIRQGARRVLQFQHNKQLPIERSPDNPWPLPPQVWKDRPSLAERGEIFFSAQTVEIVGDGERVQELRVFNGAGDELLTYKIDLVIVATGFKDIDTSLVSSLALQRTSDGKIWRDDSFRCYSQVFGSNGPALYVCGDAARGASLIVWAIAEGRSVASTVDKHLMGKTLLNQPLDAGQTLTMMM